MVGRRHWITDLLIIKNKINKYLFKKQNMSKIIKLTESQLKKIVMEMMDVSSDSPHYVNRRRKVEIRFDDLAMLGSFSKRWCEDKMGLPDCQRVREIFSDYGLMNESKKY
jgi:hypothetical protein